MLSQSLWSFDPKKVRTYNRQVRDNPSEGWEERKLPDSRGLELGQQSIDFYNALMEVRTVLSNSYQESVKPIIKAFVSAREPIPEEYKGNIPAWVNEFEIWSRSVDEYNSQVNEAFQAMNESSQVSQGVRLPGPGGSVPSGEFRQETQAGISLGTIGIIGAVGLGLWFVMK